jgi:murein DD-endopeptidase MepM/ murein hydrolase activator NlpD
MIAAMPLRIRLIVVGLAVVGAGLSVLGYRWASAPAPPPVSEATTPEPAGEAPGERLQTVQVKRGDNLVAVLARAGVRMRIGHEVATALSRGGADLRRLKPGDAIEITWSPADEPTSVSWQESPWLGYAAVAGEDGWTVKVLETTPAVRVAAVQGHVERSLFEAVEHVGEQPQLVIALVNMFEWDFDFTADTRSGDRFRLLVEKRYAGESFVTYGRVLAAQYTSSRRTLTGIGYTPGKQRFDYFDLDGRSLRKSFLKSPLEFTRITSRFTYARPHPILGGTMPHLAVDYGAPPGTPVRAVGDGVVAEAGWDGSYGLTARLRHRSGYETIYAHLSRLAAGTRAGARVNQRQVIGYVGSTGRSTGPHLHYEVVKNGRRVNPLNERFIPGDPIPAREREEFERHARALLERLDAEAPSEPEGPSTVPVEASPPTDRAG